MTSQIRISQAIDFIYHNDATALIFTCGQGITYVGSMDRQSIMCETLMKHFPDEVTFSDPDCTYKIRESSSLDSFIPGTVEYFCSRFMALSRSIFIAAEIDCPELYMIVEVSAPADGTIEPQVSYSSNFHFKLDEILCYKPSEDLFRFMGEFSYYDPIWTCNHFIADIGDTPRVRNIMLSLPGHKPYAYTRIAFISVEFMFSVSFLKFLVLMKLQSGLMSKLI